MRITIMGVWRTPCRALDSGVEIGGAGMADVIKGRRQPTLQDLAKAVGLTANTVSRALNDKSGVSATTRALIKAEAERLGYVDRKSVVEGKSVSVRVDLGGPRTLKQKQQLQQTANR